MTGGSVAQLDILQIILDAGLVVQGVLLILLLASIISWGVIFYKWSQFKRLQEENEEFLERYEQSDSLKELANFSSEESDAMYASLFTSGYQAVVKLKHKFSLGKQSVGEYLREQGLHVVERGIKKGVSEVTVELENSLSFLASVGSVTPFVGLFGTVWGIIHSFSGLASGSATLAAVAPGIAEALVATAVGLFAAIPAVWFYNFFSNRIQQFQLEMEAFGNDFLNLIERSLLIPPQTEGQKEE